jgi:hypothetical protein
MTLEGMVRRVRDFLALLVSTLLGFPVPAGLPGPVWEGRPVDAGTVEGAATVCGSTLL